jgi:hypothetical protein
MRYFNVVQHKEPKSMFSGERLVDILELEKTAREITEEQAKKKPSWGSGNISVDEIGKWKWESTDHDTSG